MNDTFGGRFFVIMVSLMNIKFMWVSVSPNREVSKVRSSSGGFMWLAASDAYCGHQHRVGMYSATIALSCWQVVGVLCNLNIVLISHVLHCIIIIYPLPPN